MFSTTISPSKGKGKDGSASTTWRTGWWDFWPLVETPRKPMQWTSSSIMVTAHPTLPTLIGRHISSSKEFQFQPLPVLLESPNSEEKVFAYFPGRQTPGVACLWRRGSTLDHWKHSGEQWSFPAGESVVGGQWLGGARGWTRPAASPPRRLPPQGPRNQLGGILLILVTEDHVMHLLSDRPGLKMIKYALLSPTSSPKSDQQSPISEAESIPIRTCIEAAVGTHYSDNTVYLALRSKSAPIPVTGSTHAITNVDLQTHEPFGIHCDLDRLGYESEISFYQVVIQLRGGSLVVSTKPFQTIDKVKNHITLMSFFSHPSSSLMFGLSTLEIDELRSSLQMYTLSAPSKASPSSKNVVSRSFEPTATRTFGGAITFAFPASQHTDTSGPLIFVGLVDPSSTIRSHTRRKEQTIGLTKVLNALDLTDNNQWESTPLWSSSQNYGVPTTGAASPNQKQVWTASFSLWHSRTTLHALPRPHSEKGQVRPEGTDLAVAILSNKSISDIVHSIARASLTPGEILDIIHSAVKTLQEGQPLSATRIAQETVGIALEIYRAKAKQSKDEEDPQQLAARWHAAQDVLSFASCRAAFEQCCDNHNVGQYDPSAAWPLTKISRWCIDFAKSLLRTCLSQPKFSSPSSQGASDDLFGSTPNSPAGPDEVDPSLVHLVHPFALGNLVAVFTQMQRFRAFLDVVPLPTEEKLANKLLSARNVLVDLIDCCPINLSEFVKILEDAKNEASRLDANILNEALVSCRPIPSSQGHLQQVVNKMAGSETLVDRARLFIEPFDLLDGVSRLSLNAQTKPRGLDIVTKEPTKAGHSLICLRCGGCYLPSQIPTTISSWGVWQRNQLDHCTCGGQWEQRHVT
ncbi:hypothetical protein DFP72DRAFT_870596 [Ephemerocybe angulata]|uniref:Mediator complex subunit 16 n=1 Tax=Ephemerocybe angulata TaxID=980116 RepID=A0A8H6MG87_9AGAR|nr:hypothetical protein DFP72DRAFT_870596 [Tulosesus angulatus]